MRYAGNAVIPRPRDGDQMVLSPSAGSLDGMVCFMVSSCIHCGFDV